MSPVRDHQGITISDFNGLWLRGDPDSTPLDHFSAGVNFDFVGGSSVRTRPGVGISQSVSVPLSNVKRIYNYPTQTANTLIVLTYDGTSGRIYHVINSTTVYGPILTITGMTDFAFQPYAGRGYISPFGDYTNGELIFQKGLQNEFLYVYAGDGTAARKAAGAAMSGTMTIANGAAGHTDPGFHIFGFVSQTVSGYNSPPGVLTGFTTSAASSVSFGSIPTSGDPNVVKRLLVATKVIPSFSGDLAAYQFFFVPGAVINDNTTTALNNISFYDADLLADASHLLRNLTQIPAGESLALYHNRLCLACTYTDISLIYVSQVGEPEAFDSISGLIVVPLDGNPITNEQEMRDVFYVFKRSRTVSYTDNGGDPSSWPLVPVDTSLGTCPHGVATVLDSGGSGVDFLLIATYQGINMFNGRYVVPELSWKVEDYWRNLDRNGYGRIQMVNVPTKKLILCVLPSRNILVANYANGMDMNKIRWTKWSFFMGLNAIAVQNVDNIILAADYG